MARTEPNIQRGQERRAPRRAATTATAETTAAATTATAQPTATAEPKAGTAPSTDTPPAEPASADAPRPTATRAGEVGPCS